MKCESNVARKEILYNLSVFLPLIDVKPTDKEILETETQFFYLVSDPTSIHFYERGDLIHTPQGLFYCIYGKEQCVPKDYIDITINMKSISDINIHITRAGDFLEDTEGTPLVKIDFPFEWYDCGDCYLSLYEKIK